MKGIQFFVLTVATLGITSGSLAHADLAMGGDLLGQTRLTPLLTDSDSIPVEGNCPSPANPPVRSVFVHAVDQAVQIDVIKLRLGDGQVVDLDVRNVFQPGSSSRIIDLPGGERCVTEIHVLGKTISSVVQQGIVQVWGIRRRLNPADLE